MKIYASGSFLTPNTYCYIKPVDTLWCCDTRAIDGYNWCKIIYDNTREADRKWKVAQHLRMDMPALLGCSLFLMVRSVISAIHLHITHQK
jgi:hypothetical protein